MANRKVIPSIFDRLTDHQPRVSREAPPAEYDQTRQYEESVARDVTALLNTRRSKDDIGEEFSLTRQSVAGYGLQDFATATAEPESVRREIERTIRTFEPRLDRLQVKIQDKGDFMFAFRITGVLRMPSGTAPVAYDAELAKESQRFRVTPGR